MKSVRVIIVNYNSGLWLQRSIQSVLDFTNAQITVIDNASSDQSAEKSQRILSDARITWLFNKENKGFAAANNQVLSVAKEEFIVLLNPDCELASNTLECIAQGFATHPEMGLASCTIKGEDGEVHPTCKRRFPTPWSALARMLPLIRKLSNDQRFQEFDYGHMPSENKGVDYVEAVSGAFMVVRASALKEVGLLDEAYFMHCEDLDWCKRFELARWQVGFVHGTSVTHAKGVGSASRPLGVIWNLHAGMNRFFDKFYRSESPRLLIYLVKTGIVVSFLARAVKTAAVALLK